MNAIKRLFTWLRPVIVVDKTCLSVLRPGETGLILISRRLHPREREEMRATLVASGLVGERRVIVMDGADHIEIVKRTDAVPADPLVLRPGIYFDSCHQELSEIDRRTAMLEAENERWRLFARQETKDDAAAGEGKWVEGIPSPVHATDESGAPIKSAADDEYAAALASVGITTPLLFRIEAACVTLGHGAKETGYRTLHALMHPNKDFEPPRCDREAAAVIFSVLVALLEDAPPERIAQISRTINERSFSSAGLL